MNGVFFMRQIARAGCKALVPLGLALGSAAADAQAYPETAVKLVVTFPAGGSADGIARIMAEYFRAAWQQPVLVENRPGGNGMVGTLAVARAVPNGHTLLFGTPSIATFKAFLKNPEVDTERDLAPISLVMVSPYVIAVSAGVPVNSLAELISYAKANPAKLNYAAVAGGQTLAVELFKQSAGIDLFRVAYKGDAQLAGALANNEVQVAFASVATIQTLLDAKKVKALAVSSAVYRHPSLPELPAAAESGLPGYDSSIWFGVVAPAKTPREILHKVAAQTAVFVKLPEIVSRFKTLGFVAASSSPEDFSRLVATEIRKWSEVARRAAIEQQ